MKMFGNVRCHINFIIVYNICSLVSVSLLAKSNDTQLGQLAQHIKPLIQSTARTGTITELGSFAGFFDLSNLIYKDPLLVSTTNGIGEKLRLAQTVGRHDTIGVDLVALCVNDLLAQGAEPLFFLDYFATGNLNIQEATELITGMAVGCKRSNCALIGGETTQAPTIFKNGAYDIAGFIVGLVERTHLLPRWDKIQPSNIIIGIASSGLHTHGYELVQKTIKELSIDINGPAPVVTDHNSFAHFLLEPSTIYTDALLPLCHKQSVHGIAHIAHGGLTDSIARILPPQVCAHIHLNNWYIPPFFRWLKEINAMTDSAIARECNLGIGMALIVSKETAPSVVEHIEKSGHRAAIIGSVEKKDSHTEPIILKNNIPPFGARIMIIGSTAQEHSIAWKLAQSPYVTAVVIAPGNGGTIQEKKIINLPMNPLHYGALIAYAQQNNIDLIVPGTQKPLMAGLVDECHAKKVRCLGPTKQTALIAHTRDKTHAFLQKHTIPTNEKAFFVSCDEAQAYIEKQTMPLLIRANTLTDHHHCIKAETTQEAIQAVQTLLNNTPYGSMGKKISIEHCIPGQELHAMVITDGLTTIPLGITTHFIHCDNDDKGPYTTDSMGSCNPAYGLTQELEERITTQCMEPLICALNQDDLHCTGFMSAHITVSSDGTPYVTSFSFELGDLHAQSVCMRLQTDIYKICHAAYEQRIAQLEPPVFMPYHAVTIGVTTGGGYPLSARTGDVITGLPETIVPEYHIFYGATLKHNQKMVTNGERVLSITALGSTCKEARNRAYMVTSQLYWPEMHYRKDIAYQALLS